MPRKTLKGIEKLCEEFLWNGRKPKMPLAKLQNVVKAGGVGLVDLVMKEKALKVGWIPFLAQNSFTAECAYNALNNNIREKIWQCNLSVCDVKKIFVNSFWRDVLESWSEYNYNDDPYDHQAIIWYNSNFKINKVPFYWRKVHEKRSDVCKWIV